MPGHPRSPCVLDTGSHYRCLPEAAVSLLVPDTPAWAISWSPALKIASFVEGAGLGYAHCGKAHGLQGPVSLANHHRPELSMHAHLGHCRNRLFIAMMPFYKNMTK